MFLTINTPIRFARFEACWIFHLPWWQLCSKIGWLLWNIRIPLFAKHTSISFLARNFFVFSCCLSSRIRLVLLFNFYRVFTLSSVFVNLLHLWLGQVFELWGSHSNIIHVLVKFRSGIDLLTAIIREKWFENSRWFWWILVVLEIRIWGIHFIIVLLRHHAVIHELVSIMTFVHFWTIVIHILHLLCLLVLVKSHQRSTLMLLTHHFNSSLCWI